MEDKNEENAFTMLFTTGRVVYLYGDGDSPNKSRE
jgi:hypothetical protein